MAVKMSWTTDRTIGAHNAKLPRTTLGLVLKDLPIKGTVGIPDNIIH